MRHLNAGRFDRDGSSRAAMFKNPSNLFANERIETTVPKGEGGRRIAERMITSRRPPGPDLQRRGRPGRRRAAPRAEARSPRAAPAGASAWSRVSRAHRRGRAPFREIAPRFVGAPAATRAS